MPTQPMRGRQPAVQLVVPPNTFEALYAEHAAFVWRSLRRLGVRESDVQDVSQEVFLVIHRRLADFRGHSTLRTWVFGVCLRTAADYRRRAHIRREEMVEQVPDQALSPVQDEAVARRQARALLDQILDELEPDQRAAFVLFELEQWPMAEVAQSMDCPLQTAYSRLYAARRHIEAKTAELRQAGGAK